MSSSELPLRYDVKVPSNGKIEVQLPLTAGSQVTVYVVEQGAMVFADLLASSVSSTAFWDNPEDDEDWNDA
jgi:hypothetical protein